MASSFSAPDSRTAAALRPIVLIFPRAEPDWPDARKVQSFPLGPLHVARPLVAMGRTVRIIDQNVVPRVEDVLKTVVDPLWIGFSVIGGHTLVEAIALARRARRLFPGVPLVWGGWNPTLMAHLYEDESAAAIVDIVVRGRGEGPVAQLTERLAAGQSLADVPGISWRDRDGKTVRNPDGAFESIAAAEPLPYHLIEEPSRYIARFGTMTFISSYGCPHRCGFCGIPVGTRTFRPMENAVVVRELERLKRELGIRSVVFLDDNFFTVKDRVLDLARRLIEAELGLDWHSNGRLDQVGPLTDEEFALLARSGCRAINVGYETGSQDVADRVQKDIRVDAIYAVADRFRQSGIRLSINFMVGLPGETPESLVASLETLRSIHARNADLEICWYIYMPAPGTALWTELVATGRLTEPRTLVEHSKFQSIDLEHPWFYRSPKRSIFREWRSAHKAVSFYFFAAFSPEQTIGWLRRRAKRRWDARDFAAPWEWRLFATLDRIKRSVRNRLAALGRTRLFATSTDRRRLLRIASTDPSFALVTGAHRST